MKASDAIAHWLAAQGIRAVFGISGGANLHIIHSIYAQGLIRFVCPQHECAGGYMADALARLTNKMQCALATSGPGATNLVTAIGTSWYDSIPMLYLTGQQSTFRLAGDSGVRQRGFQETPIVQIVRPITKYAAMVTQAAQILPELDLAAKIARAGRPGPVLVDIPDNLQREEVSI